MNDDDDDDDYDDAGTVSDQAEEAGTYMTVSRGQVVRVIALSGDWWYVEDRGQGRGYLPANYLRPYYPTQ